MSSVRFAPSPTGRFHVGNLRTAWISFDIAQILGMKWVVRFEDIDRQRTLAGAQEQQLSDMRELGLVPDEILLQTDFHARHELLFRRAISEGQVYPCYCSRTEILQSLQGLASAPHDGCPPIYDGRCRNRDGKNATSKTGGRAGGVEHPFLAWRFKSLRSETGDQDFIVARTDREGKQFTPSYHWACAIDDHDGAHTILVRAHDLASALVQQREIQAWLQKTEQKLTAFPAIFHTSLVTANDGHRLEKRTRGVTLDEIFATGMKAGQLVERLKRSFDATLLKQFKPSLIWGEAAHEIRVGLLFGSN